MKVITIDEHLVVNLYSLKKRWLSSLPRRLGAYEVAIRVKGKVRIPDYLPVIDLGDINIEEIDVHAQASME